MNHFHYFPECSAAIIDAGGMNGPDAFSVEPSCDNPVISWDCFFDQNDESVAVAALVGRLLRGLLRQQPPGYGMSLMLFRPTAVGEQGLGRKAYRPYPQSKEDVVASVIFPGRSKVEHERYERYVDETMSAFEDTFQKEIRDGELMLSLVCREPA